MAAICCEVCLLPCKACGVACGACDKACTAACKAPCCSCPEDRPSPLFLTYSILANAPIAIASLVLVLANTGDWDQCDAPWVNLNIWLLISAAMALFFLGFAVHIYRVFSRPYSPSAPDLEAQNFASRACHTACHDIPVFFYFFVAPAAFIWACIGFSVQSKARDREDLPGSQCPSSVITGTWVVALVMLLYLIGTVFVGLVSCCLEGQRSTNNPDAGQGQPSRLMAHLMRPDFGNTHTGPNSPTSASAPPYASPAAQNMATGRPVHANTTSPQYPTVYGPGPGAHQNMQQAHASVAPARQPGYQELPQPPVSDVDRLKTASAAAAQSASAALATGFSKASAYFGKKESPRRT